MCITSILTLDNIYIFSILYFIYLKFKNIFFILIRKYLKIFFLYIIKKNNNNIFYIIFRLNLFNFEKKKYFTSSDPHHDMSGGGCQVWVVRVNWKYYFPTRDKES